MVFHWSLSYSKSSQVSRTRLRILAVLSNAIIWIVSTRLPTSKSSRPFNDPLVVVLKAPITISIIVTFMFHSYFNSLARSRYCYHYYYLLHFDFIIIIIIIIYSLSSLLLLLLLLFTPFRVYYYFYYYLLLFEFIIIIILYSLSSLLLLLLLLLSTPFPVYCYY